MASLCPAQLTVTLTARVEKAPTTKCHTAATHIVRCTKTELYGATGVDLSAFERRAALIKGNLKLKLGCPPAVEVTEIKSAPASTSDFSFGGYRLNSTIVFTTRAPIGSIVVYVFAADTSFLPIPIADAGTLFLEATSLIYWTAGPSIGVQISTLRIPNEPSLVGKTALYQTAYASVTNGVEFRLLNPGCMTVR